MHSALQFDAHGVVSSGLSRRVCSARLTAARTGASLPCTISSRPTDKHRCAHAVQALENAADMHPEPPVSTVGTAASGGAGSTGSSRNSNPKARRRFNRQVKSTPEQSTKKPAVAADEDDSSAAATVPWYLRSTKKPSSQHETAEAVGESTATQDLSRSSLLSLQQGKTATEEVTGSSSNVAGLISNSSSPPLSTQLLSDKQLLQLKQYLSHMLEINKSMNLTAIRDPVEAWDRHIEDSLALLPVIDSYLEQCNGSSSSISSNNSSLSRQARLESAAESNTAQTPLLLSQQQHLTVIDVGTGAGLPGMVLAVARPQWKVTLLDSLRKRCNFLQETADMLELTNVTVVWSRAEEGAARPELREAYDLAVARAVAELRVLAELCLPFVKPGGLWVAAKGANPEAEVSNAQTALSKLSGKLLAVQPVQSWAPEGQRTAVVVEKHGSTPAKYPRAPGTPNKKPL